MKNKYVVFDLDDTLSPEIEYLKSAFLDIAHVVENQSPEALFKEMFSLYKNEENVFKVLVQRYPNFSISELLGLYREHFPNITLNHKVKKLLEFCQGMSYKMGVLTDGRSVTQRNKLKALGIEKKFHEIVISSELGSEKPNEENYKIFMKEDFNFYYIGDNTKKDFIAANNLGWVTICLLDKGQNIHVQNFDLPEIYLPDHKVKDLEDVIRILS